MWGEVQTEGCTFTVDKGCRRLEVDGPPQDDID